MITDYLTSALRAQMIARQTLSAGANREPGATAASHLAAPDPRIQREPTARESCDTGCDCNDCNAPSQGQVPGKMRLDATRQFSLAQALDPLSPRQMSGLKLPAGRPEVGIGDPGGLPLRELPAGITGADADQAIPLNVTLPSPTAVPSRLRLPCYYSCGRPEDCSLGQVCCRVGGLESPASVCAYSCEEACERRCVSFCPPGCDHDRECGCLFHEVCVDVCTATNPDPPEPYFWCDYSGLAVWLRFAGQYEFTEP